MSWNMFPERYNFATIKLGKGKKFLVEFCFTCAELRSSDAKPNPQPPRYLLSRGAAPSHSPFLSVQESFWWEKVHHQTGSYWRRWGDGPLLPTPLGPRAAPSPGEGSGHGIWDTPGGGEPPSCLRKSHSTVSHRGSLAATQQVQSGLLQSNDSTLGKGETFGLRTRRTYCRGLCPGCASRFPSRMTEWRGQEQKAVIICSLLFSFRYTQYLHRGFPAAGRCGDFWVICFKFSVRFAKSQSAMANIYAEPYWSFCLGFVLWG